MPIISTNSTYNLEYSLNGAPFCRGAISPEFSFNNLDYSLDGSPFVSNTTPILQLEMNLGTIKIYNKVLTDQEVLQNYNATKTRFGL
jgi:hypothetical protein